jgi:hypothetical protein
MMRPPLLSVVLVGISGFCGSPALTITTSVRTLPTPQPASGVAASSIKAADTMRNRRNRPPPIRCEHYNPDVIVTELAEGSAAEHVGYLIGLFGIPSVGAILLIVGLQRRSRNRRQPPFANPMAPPGYPPPGPHPYGYPPPPRPRASSGTALIVVGSLLLGFGVLGFLGHLVDAGSKAHSANVGQCVGAFTMQENNLSPAPQDCNKPDSTLEVVTKGGNSTTCPDGRREGSDYTILSDGTTTLCLMVNLRQNQCYEVSGAATQPSFVASSCETSLPAIRVVKRVDGNTDGGLCPTGTKPISYPSPARLYCLERLQN